MDESKDSGSGFSLTGFPKSHATCSIGTNPPQPLPAKLQALAKAGFKGIELAFPDLVAFATKIHGRDVGETDYDAIYDAAREVKKLCKELGLHILMLQPFANFEGWQRGSKESEEAFERAAGWVNVMKAAGTDMLQAR